MSLSFPGFGSRIGGIAAHDFDVDGDLVVGVDTSRTPFGITHTVHLRGNGGQPRFTLGFGLPGSLGVPDLEGLPHFEAPRPSRLQLWLGRPASPAHLVIGSTRWNVPFAGGAMVPAYELAFPFPGYARQRFVIYAQAWVLNPTAPQGLANGSTRDRYPNPRRSSNIWTRVPRRPLAPVTRHYPAAARCSGARSTRSPSQRATTTEATEFPTTLVAERPMSSRKSTARMSSSPCSGSWK